jgi:hypothetical protein
VITQADNCREVIVRQLSFADEVLRADIAGSIWSYRCAYSQHDSTGRSSLWSLVTSMKTYMIISSFLYMSGPRVPFLTMLSTGSTQPVKSHVYRCPYSCSPLNRSDRIQVWYMYDGYAYSMVTSVIRTTFLDPPSVIKDDKSNSGPCPGPAARTSISPAPPPPCPFNNAV